MTSSADRLALWRSLVSPSKSYRKQHVFHSKPLFWEAHGVQKSIRRKYPGYLYVAVINFMIQILLGGFDVQFKLLPITMKSGQKLKQELGSNMADCAGDDAVHNAGSSQVKRMPHRHVYKPIWPGKFFNWCSLFPRDSSLCQGDNKK